MKIPRKARNEAIEAFMDDFPFEEERCYFRRESTRKFLLEGFESMQPMGKRTYEVFVVYVKLMMHMFNMGFIGGTKELINESK